MEAVDVLSQHPNALEVRLDFGFRFELMDLSLLQLVRSLEILILHETINNSAQEFFCKIASSIRSNRSRSVIARMD